MSFTASRSVARAPAGTNGAAASKRPSPTASRPRATCRHTRDDTRRLTDGRRPPPPPPPAGAARRRCSRGSRVRLAARPAPGGGAAGTPAGAAPAGGAPAAGAPAGGAPVAGHARDRHLRAGAPPRPRTRRNRHALSWLADGARIAAAPRTAAGTAHRRRRRDKRRRPRCRNGRRGASGRGRRGGTE